MFHEWQFLKNKKADSVRGTFFFSNRLTFMANIIYEFQHHDTFRLKEIEDMTTVSPSPLQLPPLFVCDKSKISKKFSQKILNQNILYRYSASSFW